MGPTSAEKQVEGQRLSQLLRVIRPQEQFVILTHNNPDPDSIASGLALRALVREKLGIEGILAYGGVLGRAENQAMVRILQIQLNHVRDVPLKDSGTIAIVDTQPRTGNNALPGRIVPDIVIDHHPFRDETAAVTYHDVRENYGATSTMLLEYLTEAGVEVDKNLATALFYAIKTETANLVREVHQADVEAYSKLFPMIDKSFLARIEQASVPREYYHAFHAALEHSFVCNKVVVSRLQSVRNPDIVAEIADFLMRLRGTEWTFALARFGNDLILSTRTISLDEDAGNVMQRVVGDYGTAGGHGTMAGGQIRLDGLNEQAVEQLEQELTDRFLNAVYGDSAASLVREPLCESNGK